MSLRILSVIMFIGGIFLCLLFKYNEWVAKIDHMTSDETMWKMLFFVSIGIVINSIPAYGFSFIIEAACKYLENEKEAEA